MTDELIKLKWKDNSAVEIGFDVEVSLGPNNFSLLKSVPANTDSVEVTGMYSIDSTYYFRVKAKKDGKIAVSPAIANKLVFPSPQITSINFLADTSVQIQWQDKSSFEKTFEIEQSDNGTTYTVIKSVSANITTATVGGTYLAAKTYSFRLRAKTTNNVSNYSPIISKQLTFPAPSNLVISSIPSSQANLSWTDNSSFEKGFAIERKTTSDSFTEIKRVSNNVTSWFDNTLDSNFTYTYRVRAFTSINFSDYSLPISISWFNGCELDTTLKAHAGVVQSIDFSPSNSRLITSDENNVKVWNLPKVSLLHTVVPQVYTAAVRFDPSGNNIAVGGNLKTNPNFGRIELLTVGGTLIRYFGGAPSDAGITSIAFSNNGSMIAAGKWDSTATIWSVSDGARLRDLFAHHSRISSIDFSPDGKLLATGSYDRTAKLWNTSDGSVVSSFSHTSVVEDVAFSPDGLTVATCTGSGASDIVNLWSVPNGGLIRSLTGHTGAVSSVTFSPDGTILASGGYDKVIRIWRTIDGAIKDILTGAPSNIWSVRFSPDGKYIASGYENGNVSIWEFKREWRLK